MFARNIVWIALAGFALVAAGVLFALRPRLDRRAAASDPAAASFGRPADVARGDVPPAYSLRHNPGAATPPATRGAPGAPVPVVPGSLREGAAPRDARAYEERVAAGFASVRLDPGTARRLRPLVERALRDYDAKSAAGVFKGGGGAPLERRWMMQSRREMMAVAPGLDWDALAHAFPELR